MTAPRRERSDDRSRAGLVSWWALYTVVYLSMVTFTWTQVVAGALVAAVAVALSDRALRATGLHPGGSGPHLWRLGAIGSIMLAEAAAVVRALPRRMWRGPATTGRYVAFPAGGSVDASVDAALTIEASLAPNTYVVAVVEGEHGDVVLTHQFVARPGVRSSFPRWRT